MSEMVSVEIQPFNLFGTGPSVKVQADLVSIRYDSPPEKTLIRLGQLKGLERIDLFPSSVF